MSVWVKCNGNCGLVVDDAHGQEQHSRWESSSTSDWRQLQLLFTATKTRRVSARFEFASACACEDQCKPGGSYNNGNPPDQCTAEWCNAYAPGGPYHGRCTPGAEGHAWAANECRATCRLCSCSDHVDQIALWDSLDVTPVDGWRMTFEDKAWVSHTSIHPNPRKLSHEQLGFTRVELFERSEEHTSELQSP